MAFVGGHCRQFALGDTPATRPVENLSAAMALVSLDRPLRVIRIISASIFTRLLLDRFS
jgi:hypothetical protein